MDYSALIADLKKGLEKTMWVGLGQQYGYGYVMGKTYLAGTKGFEFF